MVARALEGQLVSPKWGYSKTLRNSYDVLNGIAGGILRHPSLPVQALAPCYGKSAMVWLINVSSSFYVWRPFSRWNTTPVTASVVVMEMTGAQPVLIWLLISSIIASIISRQFSPETFLPLCGWTFPSTNAGTTSRRSSP